MNKPEISYNTARYNNALCKCTKDELEQIKKKWVDYINDKYKVGYYEQTTCVYQHFDTYEMYVDFGIIKDYSYMWARKPEDVLKCKITIIEDNVVIADKYKSGYDSNSVDYFGWISYKDEDDNKNGICLIQPNSKLFTIQFPGAGDYEAKCGSGKIVRLKVDIIKEN